jgi:TM2 domain-containing membrane protein YozV
MAKEKEQRQPMPPIGAWAPAVALGWLVPGGGHFLLKRNGRGALLLLSVTSMFVAGLMMRGAMFQPQSGDLLTTLINTGGFIGDVCSGILYLLSVWLGYSQPDVAGAVHDYGTKFLVSAGLLNLLAMVDACLLNTFSEPTRPISIS